MTEQKIRTIMIIEVAGRPPQYLIDSLKVHIEKINSFKGARLISSRIAEARKVDEEKDLYTTFAEVEVETETYGKLNELIFEFMPSSIEIIEPADLVFDSQEATMIANDLAGRLHKYDEVAKIARMQIQQLSEKLAQFQQASKINQPIIQPMKITMDNPVEDKTKKLKQNKKKKR